MSFQKKPKNLKKLEAKMKIGKEFVRKVLIACIALLIAPMVLMVDP